LLSIIVHTREKTKEICFGIADIHHAQQKSVSTHEGAFSSLLNLPPELAPEYLIGLMSWSILRGGNSAPEIDYTHEIVNTHEGALLQERVPGACPGSETLRVYRPLRCFDTAFWEHTKPLESALRQSSPCQMNVNFAILVGFGLNLRVVHIL